MALPNLAQDRAARIAEFKKRNRRFDLKRVSSGEFETYFAAGWEIDKELKLSTRIRRPKRHDEVLENQVWILLYRLGYATLSVGRDFKIPVISEGQAISKQIDVFAADDETFIVAECKSSENKRKRSLQKDIGEFQSLKRPIANSLRKSFGENPKRKILWLLVTSNIRWTQEDLARAESNKIIVIQDHELRYFQEIARTLGKAAKYQFHAEFLAGEKIPALDGDFIPATRFRLGGRFAYSFTVNADQLLKRAFVNHRDLRDPSGAPSYQRLITPNRLKKIAHFVERGGYFANSILVNFHRKLRFDLSDKGSDGDVQFGRLYLPNNYKSCWVIDGQHRLYGAAVAAETAKVPMIPVVAFEGLPTEDEANLFATINREQKPVQKKLLDELEGELKWGSSDPKEAMNAIASRALDIMRNDPLGPFEDRIALPGTKGKNQPLTVPQLKPEITRSGLIGRVSPRDGQFIAGPLVGEDDKRTLENLCEFLSCFFDAVRNSQPTRWELVGFPLCHNTAVAGLLRLATAAVDHLQSAEKIDAFQLSPSELAKQAVEVCKPFVTYCREASDEEFRGKFQILFGSGGPRRYYLTAAALIHDSNEKFNPEGLDEFIEASSEERTSRAVVLVKQIVDSLHGHVVKVLREQYGEKFFDLAIRNQQIKVRAYQKRVESDPTGETPLENYLDVLDLKKIVEAKENWTAFEKTLDVRLPDQPKGGLKFVKWIEELNEIRKKFAHPYNRSYSDSEFTLLEYLHQELMQRGVIDGSTSA